MYRLIKGFLFFYFLSIGVNGNSQEKSIQFVACNGREFLLNHSIYKYVGVNYWYGSLLALREDADNGKKRLLSELDFLQSKGVNNLRILAGGEGEGAINGSLRVTPSLQPERGVFDERILQSLDFLLFEMGRRNMKAVLYFSNNWEWSGGWLQYLNWHGKISDSVMHRKLSWDEFRDYGSKFYDCNDCKEDYLKQLKLILLRTNSLTQRKYIEDPVIMSWELANEPRPMRPSSVPAFKQWINEVAAYIRFVDKNHLITLGTEGAMGVENVDVFRDINDNRSIDYLTVHIWPKNWGWIKDTAIADNFNDVLIKTTGYLKDHDEIAKKLNKPLVIEEFGLPRDGVSFDPMSAVTFRDKYFKFIFSQCFAPDIEIAGCNFWAFSGMGRPVNGQVFWRTGDVYLGDPPVEEQGLNSVFDTDKSTWDIIEFFTKKCKR